MSKYISLGKSGYQAIVDDEDYTKAMKFKWYLLKCSNLNYAICAKYMGKINGKDIIGHMLLHRYILHPPHKNHVDHINHNGLDCRKKNMRICTSRENQYNGRSRIHSSSIFKGVDWNKNTNKWRSRIRYNGKQVYLGLFDSEREAAQIYNIYAKKFHGEYANLNCI